MSGSSTWRLPGLVAVLGILALPASAVAHDSYVNQGTGHDSGNDCSDKTDPCKGLLRGIAQAGKNDTVFVAGGYTYTASLILDDGKSLVHKNFGGASGAAILDNGSADAPDVFVTYSPAAGHSRGAGRVSGFTIRSQHLPMSIGNRVTVVHNTFDESAAIDTETEILVIDTYSAPVTIKNNTFVDPTPGTGSAARQVAIQTNDDGDGVLKVSGNEFQDFWEGIEIDWEHGPKIEGNEFTGTHAVDGYGGASIDIVGGPFAAIVKRNFLHDPDLSVGAMNVAGIVVYTKGTIDRNRVLGYTAGVAVGDTHAAVHLSSDAIVNPPAGAAAGLQVSDYDKPDPGKKDAIIDGLTVWGPGEAIELQKAQISLDSSVLGGTGINPFYSHDHCAIKHSRGPHKHAAGNGCEEFQTTKDPRFKSDDYHLKDSSPMIDGGNPTKPPKGSKDVDGDKRALDGPDGGTCHGARRRDIGADEFRC